LTINTSSHFKGFLVLSHPTKQQAFQAQQFSSQIEKNKNIFQQATFQCCQPMI